MVPKKPYRDDPALRNAGYREHGARNLCGTCYTYVRYHDQLGDWPRLIWRRDDLLDEWVWLRDVGVDVIEAAQRIGVSPHALDRALHRAVAAGDDRGRHTGCRRLDHLRTRSGLTTTAAGV
jgi:hypothetical protein